MQLEAVGVNHCCVMASVYGGCKLSTELKIGSFIC